MSSIYGSAAGANVIYEKNNPGVAFSAPAADPVCQTTQAWDDSSTVPMSALYDFRVIQGAVILTGSDFIDQNLVTATFNIVKTGSPEGTITCKLYETAVINSGLSSVIETSSNSFSMQTSWSDGDHAFTFSGVNDIAVNNGLVIFCTFTTGAADKYVNLLGRPDTTSSTEPLRQYERDPDTAQWEGNATFNPRFKVCNY